jgi:hypothetical protein
MHGHIDSLAGCLDSCWITDIPPETIHFQPFQGARITRFPDQNPRANLAGQEFSNHVITE